MLYRKGTVRAFLAQRHDRQGNAYQVVYACFTMRDKPRALFTGDIGSTTTADTFRLWGARLGYHVYVAGGVASEDYLGWVNEKSKTVRYTLINGSDPQDPAIPTSTITYQIANDGAVAVIGSNGPEQAVAFIPVSRRALGTPRTLASTGSGGLDPSFIMIDATTVSWRTTLGVVSIAVR